MTHTGYEADAIAQRDKFQRAQTIMAAYLAEHPHDAYICNKLGALHGSSGDWETGRSLLEKGLADTTVDAATLYELHYHLGLAYRDAGLTAIAVDHYQKALAQPIAEVLKVGAYLNLGSLHKLNQIPDSSAAFRQAGALYRQTQPAEAERLLQGIRNLGIQPE